MLKEVKHIEQSKILTVLSRYHLPAGEIKVFRSNVGFINTTYIVQIGRQKVVLRESSPLKTREHLEFEVEVLQYLEKDKFPFTARVLPNHQGQYITVFDHRYYILQSFILGSIKASWNNVKNLNERMLEDFCKTVALFTRAVSGFKGKDFSKKSFQNQTLYFYISNGHKFFKKFLNRIPQSKGKDLLIQEQGELMAFVDATKHEMDAVKYDELPKQVVHFDFHPGNVHFIGNKVSGVFDFDWVRFDCRISDIAATIGQSCWFFGGESSGKYRKDRIQLELKAYRKAYGKSEYDLKQENYLIKIALKGYMFFQLLWAMDWYSNNIASKNLPILRTMVNTLKVNDYERLFVF